VSKLSFREDEVPQLQDISESLKAVTGWQVVVSRKTFFWGGRGSVATLALGMLLCTAVAQRDRADVAPTALQ
jgi:hypothetical protein